MMGYAISSTLAKLAYCSSVLEEAIYRAVADRLPAKQYGYKNISRNASVARPRTT
ncbi:hypothetical protein [Argonema galeatum]|uniref:hypothetical protein n=1 Tax=Argonema galeatum TaxID=2942762 RepID=UPI002010E982|nr:hypothetical protein [Argonema galeatum]MCL1465893.1 hypothetical protein [Argonema galeatum A003/A1]